MDGAAAEQRAAAHLAAHGLTLLDRNWRCKGGELDLVARDGKTLVFVEVRARASRAFGGAAASITAQKQARLIHAAQAYLQQHRLDAPCRFDAVLIEGDALTWLKGAFEA